MTVVCSVQYRVMKQNADDAFYELQNPREQIQSYVFDGEEALTSKAGWLQNGFPPAWPFLLWIRMATARVLDVCNSGSDDCLLPSLSLCSRTCQRPAPQPGCRLRAEGRHCQIGGPGAGEGKWGPTFTSRTEPIQHCCMHLASLESPAPLLRSSFISLYEYSFGLTRQSFQTCASCCVAGHVCVRVHHSTDTHRGRRARSDSAACDERDQCRYGMIW